MVILSFQLAQAPIAWVWLHTYMCIHQAALAEGLAPDEAQ